MLITDISQLICNFMAGKSDTSRMSTKQINTINLLINSGEIQLRQQLNVGVLFFFQRVSVRLVVSLVSFPTAYDTHTLIADLPVGHSEDAQIICYYEVNINCALNMRYCRNSTKHRALLVSILAL